MRDAAGGGGRGLRRLGAKAAPGGRAKEAGGGWGVGGGAEQGRPYYF